MEYFFVDKKLLESLVRPLLVYNSEIWYMDFYEKILKRTIAANKSNSNFDLIDSLDTSFLESALKTNCFPAPFFPRQ
jgi:hypothetical protein